MSSYKKICITTAETNQKNDADKLSPEEEALSITLILDNIFKYLSAQEIIRASLVNKTLCAFSREFFRIKSNSKNKLHYPVCIQIRTANPCKSLASFNSYLAENRLLESTKQQEMLTFNGIQQSYKKGAFNYICTDCLINDSRHPTDLPISSNNIKYLYGHILAKVKFKYIRFNPHVPTTCPFAILMNFLISQRRDEIVELDFDVRLSGYNDDVVNGIYLQNDRDNQPRCFPNLEMLRAPNLEHNFPILAPALKIINKNIPFNIGYLPRAHNFPFHVITSLASHGGICQSDISELIEFLQQRKPNLKDLLFDFKGTVTRRDDQEILSQGVYRQRLFELGRACASLEHLHCTLYTFMSMASTRFLIYLHEGVELKNRFPDLKRLSLKGGLEAHIVDWFSWMEFSKNFPQLKEVRFEFSPSTGISDFNGPYNQNHGCASEGVKILRLEITEQNFQDKMNKGFPPEMISRVFKLFPHIRHLDLKHMKLKLNCYDRIFAEIINEIQNLPFLEELAIFANALDNFSLDYIFLEQGQLLEIEQTLGRTGMKTLFLFKSTVLDHKKLKRIFISADGAACRTIKNCIKCFSDQPPDHFLVSSRTAKNICKYLPGFQFHILISNSCRASHGHRCENNVGVDGLRSEHLLPYATITTTELASSDGNKRVIEFVDIKDDKINA